MKIAGVRFRDHWKVYDFDATGLGIALGDRVIVESDRGQGFARVVRIRESQELEKVEAAQTAAAEASPAEGAATTTGGAEAASQESSARKTEEGPKGLRRIVRKAAEEDITKDEKNRALEKEAFDICQELIFERELPMKLISVEYTFDASRVTFFFFSETRVDFRELVKELAHKLRSRIEMRQIGVRDVTRMIGGYGPCGRELCCASHLRSFEPVSIRMAKKQEMVLNPAKISGVCGRLLCCLSYEYEFYDDIKKDIADMKESVEKEKKERERRMEEERREAEARRIAEEKRRQEEDRKRQEEARREKQKAADQKTESRQEKKKEPQQEQKAKPPQEQGAEKQQKAGLQQAEGEKGPGRRRRRFWRKKKKKQQGGGDKPQNPQS